MEKHDVFLWNPDHTHTSQYLGIWRHHSVSASVVNQPVIFSAKVCLLVSSTFSLTSVTSFDSFHVLGICLMDNFHEVIQTMARGLYHLNGKVIKIRGKSQLK